MTTTVKLPSLGESVDAGRILSVLVSEGDEVTAEDPILEVETDKATVEVPATEAGTVVEILVAEGDDVETGQELLVLRGADEGGSSDAGDADRDTEQDAARDTDDDRPRARRGRRKDAKKRRDRRAAEPAGERTADAEPDGRSEQGRTAKQQEESAKQEKQEKPEKQDQQEAGAEQRGEPEQEPAGVARDEPGSDAPREEADEERDRPAKAPASPRRGRPSAPPHVRRLARQLGIDLGRVAAARADRLTDDDLFSHVRDRLERAPVRDGGEPRLPDFTTWGEIERQPISGVRRATAQTVRDSWRRVPQVTHFDTARIDRLHAFRAAHGGDGGGLSMTAVLIKIVAEALVRFPRFNSSFDAEAEELVLKEFVHIGVAVDTARGLLVPVLRDVQDKGIRDLDAELPELLGAARAGELGPDDLAGATFSVSNVGSIGGSHFTPLVVWPQVAILGMGRAAGRLVRDGDEVTEVTELPLSLSYDHRVVDGADAARFARWIVEALEDPLTMLLDV